VRVPVLAIAGEGDGIAPIAACHHVGELLPSARSVRLETAPGGHLGVLTGRAARGTTWAMLDRFLAEHEASPRPRRRRAAA
jgi:polyhydroxyalkanoate synthase